MALTYYLQIESTGAIMHAGINDVPLFVDATGEGLTMNRPINEWIRPTDNRLTAALTWPGRKPFEAGLAELTLHLRTSLTGELEPEKDPSLAEIVWPPKNAAEGYPAQLTRPCPITVAPEATLWSQADRLTPPTDPERDAIVARVEELRAALTAKDFERAYVLTRYRFEDEARANGQAPDEVRTVALRQFRMLQKPPQITSAPLAAKDADCALVANDQLVHVTRLPQGEEAIVFDTGRLRLKLDVFVARIAGEWQIAR